MNKRKEPRILIQQDSPKDTAYLSVPQLANYLGVDQTTIRRWCRSGNINAAKIGFTWMVIVDVNHPPKVFGNLWKSYDFM